MVQRGSDGSRGLMKKGMLYLFLMLNGLEPWKQTLVIKVIGKRVNFKMLENKLQRT